MNRRARYILYGVLSAVVLTSLFFIFFINVKNNKVKNKLLATANNIIENGSRFTDDKTIEQESYSIERIAKDDGVIGKIIIPSINVEAPIKEGTSEIVLKEAVGHFENSKYWDGNVCLASHNRGTYAHYFQKLDKLKIGDEISYETKLGKKTYLVADITNISEYDLSVIDNTACNCLTLITCIKNKPEYRLCVRAIEK